MSVLREDINPILELSQIIVRIMPVIVGLSLISWIHDWGKFPYEEFLWWFIGFYVIQFIVETQYTFMHIQQKVWQNPFSPILGENVILKKFRKIYYWIVRMTVYFEWYFTLLIPVFWFIGSIFQFLNTPDDMNYILLGVGLVITLLCSYIGRKVMKKRYFTADTDMVKREEPVNKEVRTEKRVSTSVKLYFGLIQIMIRGMAVLLSCSVIYSCIEIARYGDKNLLEESYLTGFIFITVVFLGIEVFYDLLHSVLRVWSNPMTPIVVKGSFSNIMKGLFYFILRSFVYFERYLFKGIPYFWLVICIYRYMRLGAFMDLASFLAGTVALFILSYMGTKMVNKRYFSEQKV